MIRCLSPQAIMNRSLHRTGLGLSVIGSCLFSACKNDTKEAAADKPAAANAVSFNAAQVEHGGIKWEAVGSAVGASMLEVPAQVVPSEDRIARLGAPLRGRVVRVDVLIGQRVTSGQPLVTIQSQDAAAARADYDKAVAELASRRAAATYARTARERAERLLAAKAIARQDVERALADDELARAQLAQAEAEVERARSTISQLGVGSNGMAVVSATLTGVVLSRDAVPGTVVEAGTPLVSITDPTSLDLDMNVPDRAASGLVIGARVRFAVPAFPSDTFEARVKSIGSALEESTRTLLMRAAVVSTKGKLRPAMFATAWVEGGDRRSMVTVPDGAVQLLDERPVAFVAIPDGKGGARFDKRELRVGATTSGRTQVLQGLSAGDVVVTTGAFAVKSEFSRSKMAKE